LLSNEKLDYTNVLEHRIPTINEIPKHTQQYRFVKKRWRMVLDFRGLNNKTVGDAYFQT